MLLESYLTLCGAFAVRRVYIKLRLARVLRNEIPDNAAVLGIIQQSQFALYGFLLLTMGRGSQTVSDPLYQMSGFLKSRGLSNQGMSIVSRFGWCYPKATFLRHKDGSLAVLAEELRFFVGRFVLKFCDCSFVRLCIYRVRMRCELQVSNS
jgi:hypothetical protein